MDDTDYYNDLLNYLKTMSIKKINESPMITDIFEAIKTSVLNSLCEKAQYEKNYVIPLIFFIGKYDKKDLIDETKKCFQYKYTVALKPLLQALKPLMQEIDKKDLLKYISAIKDTETLDFFLDSVGINTQNDQGETPLSMLLKEVPNDVIIELVVHLLSKGPSLTIANNNKKGTLFYIELLKCKKSNTFTLTLLGNSLPT